MRQQHGPVEGAGSIWDRCEVLRSVGWDGPAPALGDVLVGHPLGPMKVVRVAAGAGVGHWTLWCDPTRVIEWNPASWLA